MPANLILVGQVTGPFGVKGEVRITAFTADPASLLDYGVLLDEAGKPVLTLGSGRVAQNGIIAETRPQLTREQAQGLRGLRLYIDRNRLPPPEDEDEFYLVDLIGLDVVSPDGNPIGQVKFVSNFGAGDLLEIAPTAPGQASWYAPFTKEAVPKVDLAARRIVVDRPAEIEAEREAYDPEHENDS